MGATPPSIPHYACHILICEGECGPAGAGTELFAYLGQLLGEHGRAGHPTRVVRSTSSCLGVCVSGPIVVVYPEGIWYHSVDRRKLERIVEEHLKGGRPVEEYIFHRLDRDGAHPANT